MSDVLARCLSPGPFYDGPAIDRESLLWPLSVCPNWPINGEWLDFAFEKVTFRPLTVDIDISDIPDIAFLATFMCNCHFFSLVRGHCLTPHCGFK